jgi:lipid A 3-O-deacylase
MKMWRSALLAAAAFVAAAFSAAAQSVPASTDSLAAAALANRSWEYGPFFQGGTGVGDRSDFTLLSAGVRLGKVLTGQHLGSIFRGQFEYAGELIPYWQAFTPPPHLQSESYPDPATGLTFKYVAPVGGGTYTGVSLTPIILRWDFQPRHRLAPFFQAAGGLIYTTHKFPPDVLVQHGTPGGTSVWNFSPQGGIGLQYFLSAGRSLMFSANAIHISSASLGDKNPGVNASVQFQIGYTWWSRGH